MGRHTALPLVAWGALLRRGAPRHPPPEAEESGAFLTFDGHSPDTNVQFPACLFTTCLWNADAITRQGVLRPAAIGPAPAEAIPGIRGRKARRETRTRGGGWLCWQSMANPPLANFPAFQGRIREFRQTGTPAPPPGPFYPPYTIWLALYSLSG
jgi:hypothetical protein